MEKKQVRDEGVNLLQQRELIFYLLKQVVFLKLCKTRFDAEGGVSSDCILRPEYKANLNYCQPSVFRANLVSVDEFIAMFEEEGIIDTIKH